MANVVLVSPPFLKDYIYWNVGLSRPVKRLSFALDYFDTDDRGEDLWGELAGARIVAGVSYRIH